MCETSESLMAAWTFYDGGHEYVVTAYPSGRADVLDLTAHSQEHPKDPDPLRQFVAYLMDSKEKYVCPMEIGFELYCKLRECVKIWQFHPWADVQERLRNEITEELRTLYRKQHDNP